MDWGSMKSWEKKNEGIYYGGFRRDRIETGDGAVASEKYFIKLLYFQSAQSQSMNRGK